MSSTSFRSGVYSRPWARPVTRSRAGFFEPSGVPPPYDGTFRSGVGVPPPYDGTFRGGVGVPPPYDGTFRGVGGVRGGVGGVGVPPPYDGTLRGVGGVRGGVGGGGVLMRSRSIFKHDAGYIGYLSDDESLGEAADAADADSDVVGRRHREVIAQMHGREISFTHTVFAVVALLMFCVYFVAFIDRMRVNAFNATSMR